MSLRMKLFLRAIPAALVTWALIVDFLVPESRWFEVERVQVYDTIEGISPKMVVSRKVNRPFRGHWIVTVKKAENALSDSGYYANCVASGESDYREETKLPPPDKLNLNWWTYPRDCDLKAGTYIVSTSWTFDGFFKTRTVTANSNFFVVKAQ